LPAKKRTRLWALALANITHVQTTADSLAIEFERTLPLEVVQQAIEELRSRDPSTLLPEVNEEALEGMKFSDCLPPTLAVHVLSMRTRDLIAVAHVLRSSVRLVSS
jgi:ATP-dependent helicase Lhr and Lhr-like helicase